jgi:Zn-dependent protease with chaperone function
VTLRPVHRALALLLSAALAAGSGSPLAAARTAPPQPAGAPSPDGDLFGKSLEAAAEALELYGSWDEPAALRRVADLGYRVAAESGFTQFPISFYLIDMPEPNAFALPAGQIFVTRGMLSLGLTDDELAALLGHEIAHVVERHGIRMERRATLLNVLTQALVVGVMVGAERNRDSPRPGDVPDPYGIERADTGQGDLVYGTYAASLILSELLLRSHSRDFEDDADELGQRWAAAAGFRPDSTERLMAALGSRLPDASKEYGYWRTHPFFEQRLQAAKIRGQMLAQGEEKNPAEFRSSTQKQLLGYVEGVRPDLKAETRPKPRPTPPAGAPQAVERKPEVSRPALVEQAALTAWPRGIEAERLRLARIHKLRDAALSVQPLARDYGRLLAAYDREAADLAAIDPSSPLLEPLRGERAELSRQVAALYPEAHAVWDGGIWETPFLEIFLSNWPEAPVAADVALALGEAYSRSARPADAVAQFLRAWRAAPASPAATRAQRGLRNLAPGLRELTALGELAAQEQDAELRGLAEARLTQLAASYADLASGAEYLARFPEGPHVGAVAARLNVLAENLYGEVVLYQSVGDHVKAIERIQSILTHAPASPAAQKLLDRVVLPS